MIKYGDGTAGGVPILPDTQVILLCFGNFPLECALRFTLFVEQ